MTPKQKEITKVANYLYNEFERTLDSSFRHIDKLNELCDDIDEEIAIIKHFELISKIQLEFIEILNNKYNENLTKVNQMEDDLFKN